MKPCREHNNVTFYAKRVFLFTMCILFASCSFDYSAGRESERNKPDIVMEDIEYSRVRGGDLLVIFQAEYAERWEERQIMEFRNFVFTQMEDKGETVNAEGWAGAAVVQTGSGDISLSDGVKIDIKSEDIIIRTAGLEWIDKEKHLFGKASDYVEIESSEGTSFIGRGFSADARNRTWAFSGKVEGRYVESEDEEETEEDIVIIEWIRGEGYSIDPRPEYYSHEEYILRELTPEEQETLRKLLEEK